MKRTTAPAVALVLTSALAPLASAAPPAPGLSVEIVDYLRMPQTTGGGSGYARINFLRDLPDASGRIMVNDLRGYLYFVQPDKSVDTYLNLKAQFGQFSASSGLAGGFVSAAFHPEFAANGKFYTVHTETASGNPATPTFTAAGNAGTIGYHSVLTEWTSTDPTAQSFAGTKRELFRVATPVNPNGTGNQLHNLGELAFNPTASPGDDDYGLLYIGGGDGGYDAYNRGDDQAQRLDSVFGKILRIDPTGTNSANGQYGIPTANPFASDDDNDGTASLNEIYAYGFRNAHRLAWDNAGRLFTTDIGHNTAEEVNIVHAGLNYGWSEVEGNTNYSLGEASLYTAPVAQYLHHNDDYSAIAGGFVYQGSHIPDLVGKFVFGDIVSGKLFYADVADMLAADDGDPTTLATVNELMLTRDGASITLQELVGGPGYTGRVDLRFGQTADGEIYVMDKQDGYIRVLVPEPGTPALLLAAAATLLGRRKRRA